MKISGTYSFIASLLCFSILVGVSLPGGLHAKSLEECDRMEAEPADHQMPITMMAGHNDCPMEDQHRTDKAHASVMEVGMHDFGFACACNIEQAPVKTESQVMQNVKVPILTLKKVIGNFPDSESESDYHAILTLDSYSQPPIYLTNESFLI